MIDYLHIIKTRTYQNDSRLIKWINSLGQYGHNSHVFILQDDNISRTFSEDNTPIKATSLFVRRFFKKQKGFIFKIPEFTWRTLAYIRKFPAKHIIFHDLQHYLTLLILCLIRSKSRKIIWDLHELPHEALQRVYFTRLIIRFILNRVDCLVYTNHERRRYVLKIFRNTEKKYFILNNYTDDVYLCKSMQPLPLVLHKWLSGNKYVVWLGAGIKKRNFISFLKAFTESLPDHMLVILGTPDQEASEFIVNNSLASRVYSTFVLPKEMIDYIDNADFSIVLYKNTSPNNYYCEPNRLYQLTARRIPVITGNNPPMKSLVNRYGAGIVLPDDGSDVNSLKKAIKKMLKCKEQYKDNLEKSNLVRELSWENQFKEIIEVLEGI